MTPSSLPRPGASNFPRAIQTVLLYEGDSGRPRARRIITDLDPTQQRLYNLFNLDRYAPRR